MIASEQRLRYRVGLVFAGGPAPGANAVIAAAVAAFRLDGVEVLGFRRGFSHLEQYDAVNAPMQRGEHYMVFEDADLWGLRNARGIIIGTARSSPGADVKVAADLDRPECTEGLRRMHAALSDLGVEALITIGGDGTLGTAVRFHQYQQRLPTDAARVRVVHIPKTIDNDYEGIDFAFGFFTAVDVLSHELQNLRADALATDSYFITQTMGRQAGWLAYGVAIAGEAHMVVGVEDVLGELRCADEVADDGRACLSIPALVDRIVDLMLSRAARGKRYGTVVLAEGLGALLQSKYLESVTRHPDGTLSLASIDLARLVAAETAARYQERTGQPTKVTGVQLGYESRCSPPHAFDVMLGCQLGVGAYRALMERGLDGCMVSVSGPLDLRYVPFKELVDPVTLRVAVRYVERGSDYERLARLLESRRGMPIKPG